VRHVVSGFHVTTAVVHLSRPHVVTAHARAQEESREENRRDNEQATGDDADPREGLVKATRLVLCSAWTVCWLRDVGRIGHD
jgi:hypothetical protein